MKKLLTVAAIVWMSAAGFAQADEQTRTVQQKLQEAGFYYGQIDGVPGEETSAAIRRYQIRHGLEVTGELNAETLKALGVGGPAPAAQSKPEAPLKPQTPPPPQPGDTGRPVPGLTDDSDLRKPPVRTTPPPAAPKATPRPTRAVPREDSDLRVERPPVDPRQLDADREFLGKSRVPGQPGPPAPPQTQSGVIPPAILFSDTPYDRAPAFVQEEIIRQAQSILRQGRYYDGRIDGAVGPATAGAIDRFQSLNRLPRTGRLDLETLNVMGLLPNQRGSRHLQPFEYDVRGRTAPGVPPPVPGEPVYRGRWLR